MMAGGVAALALAPQPAGAGFFEQLFGGLRHMLAPPPPVKRYADPFSSFARAVEPPQERARERNVGPARAFCVRTCDGHYFPVRAHAGLSAAQACHAFCPASATRLYAGSSIDYALAPDGSRYADLDTAFLYRKRLVAGCTCNGRTAFGVASIPPQSDPTLRPGDVVATQDGLMAYAGGNAFTPVASYGGFTPTQRAQLANIKVTPPPYVGMPGEILAGAPQQPARSAALSAR
jgi:hypothetical protein